MPANRSGEDVPVVVVGAGPVGLLAALLLSRHGVSSVVVDARRSASEEGSKAICIQRDSLEIADRVGIAGTMVAEGVTWRIGRTFYRDDELFHIELPTDATAAFPPFVNISQARTEALLVEKVRACPMIDLRYGHNVVAVRDLEDGVETELSNGAVLRSLYVLGCDGARSVVRRSMGCSFDGMSFDEQFLIADIRCALDFGNERRFFFDPSWNPGRQVLVHPCPEGIWRIDWQVPADFDLPSEQEAGRLDDRIRKVVGSRPYDVVWLSVYRFHQRRASAFVKGRVLLCGDSAHIYAPFGARGLNAGFHDAENAAWKVAATVQGWAGPDLLASYALEREEAADENLRVTAETMKFLVPADTEGWDRRRDLLGRVREDPLLRPHINSGRLAEPYWYNGSPLTTGGTLDGFATEPGSVRPVQPGVLCPDLPIRSMDDTRPGRLRRLFGSSFVALTVASDETAITLRLPPAVPCEVVSFDRLDQTGALAEVLGAGEAKVVLVRPDGYLAAIVDRDEAASALNRAVGRA